MQYLNLLPLTIARICPVIAFFSYYFIESQRVCLNEQEVCENFGISVLH